MDCDEGEQPIQEAEVEAGRSGDTGATGEAPAIQEALGKGWGEAGERLKERLGETWAAPRRDNYSVSHASRWPDLDKFPGGHVPRPTRR